MEHRLKTWPEAYEAISRGDKTHESRKADRQYEIEDTLLLQEWTPAHEDPCALANGSAGEWRCSKCQRRWDEPLPGTYTGRAVRVLVTYLTRGPAYGLPNDLAVMSIRVLSEDEQLALEMFGPEENKRCRQGPPRRG